jgi:hypothetical protein
VSVPTDGASGKDWATLVMIKAYRDLNKYDTLIYSFQSRLESKRMSLDKYNKADQVQSLYADISDSTTPKIKLNMA